VNEQIQALADQAGATFITTKGHECIADGCYIVSPDKLEKFAQLIVQECLAESLNEIVSDEEIAQVKDPLNQEYLRGNNQGIIDAVVRFSNHFGVEE
jgi:predicted Zn-dependent peptidase